MGARNRYAARTDQNQAQILRELREIPGLDVVEIKEPVDLMIGHQAMNYLFEVKRADKVNRPSAYTPQQRQFLKDWPGQVRVATTTEDILDVVHACYRCTRCGHRIR